MKILKPEFYNRSTLKVAQDLLGCFLVRKTDNKFIKAMIIETEAYNGPKDLASHASRGITKRNRIMFGEPGMAYVYFTYGMHNMLNVVTEKRGYPAAVLIRAVDPVGSINAKTNGPAKLTKAMHIDREFNGLSVCVKKYGLWIEKGKEIDEKKIVKATRVGVDYAGVYKDKKWRYYLKENVNISKNKVNLL